MACERIGRSRKAKLMLRFKMLSDGSLDTLAKCEHCGKVERFAAYDAHFPAYELEVWNSAEDYRSMVGTMLREAGHHWDGCEV
jgi:hypothetical protein